MSWDKPEGCKDCPLYNIGDGFVTPKSLPANPILLIQGEAPGKNEVMEGQPFIGDSGHWLRRNILYNLGVSENDVVFDNTLRCLVPNKYPTGKNRKEAETKCRQYDIWEKFPHAPLILMGSKAIGQHLGDDRVSKWHGHIFFTGKRWVGCTFHPAAVMRNPNLLPVVIQEIANLLAVVQNPNLMKEHKIEKWLPTVTLPKGSDVVFDLEWGADRHISVVGFADSKDWGNSSYTTHISPRRYVDSLFDRYHVVGGHNIIDADLPMLQYFPDHIWKLIDEERIHDTMISSHIVHPHLAGTQETNEAGAEDANLGLYGLSDMIKFYEPTAEWKHLKDDILKYNGYDVVKNFRLMKHLQRDLEYTKQSHLLKKDQKLAVMCHEMKNRGLAIDVTALEAFAKQTDEEHVKLREEMTFNPNSPKQVMDWAKGLGIKLKNAQISTLLKQQGKSEEFDKLLAYRENNKSLVTWFPVDKSGNVLSDRVHPKYHVTGTAVCRLSCSKPNVLNIPLGGLRHMEDGKTRYLPNLRRFFVPDEGFMLYSWDFSQIENRMLAMLFEDDQMLADFNAGLDIHRLIASRIFNVNYEDVTDEQRFKGKTTVHATNYCESAYNLATRIFGRGDGKSVQYAQQLQDSYFRAYPKMRAGQDRVAEQLDRGDIGLRNPYGRFRRVFAQNSHERKKRGVHYLGCSTAAEFVNQKAIDIKEELGLLPFQHVYDELCYALPIDEKVMVKRIGEILLTPDKQISIIIPVELKTGMNYGSLVKEKK